MAAAKSNRGWSLALVLLLLLCCQLCLSAEDWHFTSENYIGRIPECSVACDRLYVTGLERMGIQIKDRQKLSSVKYRIVNREVDEFKADEKIVGDFAFLFIRTKTDGTTNLNRERTAYYSLNVKAKVTLTDGRVVNSFTRVSITIADVNDAPPLFMEYRYQFDVPNTLPVFSTIGEVKATDADEGFNAEIYYAFDEVTEDFAVHPTSGSVYLTRALSHSGRTQYNNQLVAYNRGRGRQTKVPIQFTVVERNQHVPTFTFMPRPAMSAYTPVGMTVLVIKVCKLVSRQPFTHSSYLSKMELDFVLMAVIISASGVLISFTLLDSA